LLSNLPVEPLRFLFIQFSLSRRLTPADFYYIFFSFKKLKFTKGSWKAEEKQALLDFSEFHLFIVEGKVEEVQKFIVSNPNEKMLSSTIFLLSFLRSPCSLKIYEILIKNGFQLSPSVYFASEDIVENPQMKTMKTKLKDIHRKQMKDSSKKHLMKLNLIWKPLTSEERTLRFFSNSKNLSVLLIDEMISIHSLKHVQTKKK
jgi:hypothetical protein